MKGRLLINKMQSQISNPRCIELLFVPWLVLHIYCDKFFINKPAFCNFLPELIKKIYRVATSWFYKFPCAVGSSTGTYLFNGKTVSRGNMCANQSVYEVLIILIGMICNKETLNELSLLVINTYRKTFEKILSYFLECLAQNVWH